MERLSTRLIRLPLGAGRGGSGATSVELLFVTVRDTDGVEGTGYTYSLDGGISACERVVHDLFAPRLSGAQVDDWDRQWHELWAAGRRLGHGIALPALSAVDIAVWDLRAKRAQKPLYRLLGAHREVVPIYGGGRSTHAMTDDELIAGARSYVEEGYTQVKLRAGALGLQRDVQRIGAVRDAVGDGVGIMVDCNERLSLPDALWFAVRMRELGVYWLEEPLMSEQVGAYDDLARHSPVAIAVGEHLHGQHEFANFLKQARPAVVMPDLPLTGGFSEGMRIATLAENAGAVVSPHFLPELHIHYAAAAPAGHSVEHFPLIDDLLGEKIAVSGGMAKLPQRPGHGIVWDRDALDHFAVSVEMTRML